MQGPIVDRPGGADRIKRHSLAYVSVNNSIVGKTHVPKRQAALNRLVRADRQPLRGSVSEKAVAYDIRPRNRTRPAERYVARDVQVGGVTDRRLVNRDGAVVSQRRGLNMKAAHIIHLDHASGIIRDACGVEKVVVAGWDLDRAAVSERPARRHRIKTGKQKRRVRIIDREGIDIGRSVERDGVGGSARHRARIARVKWHARGRPLRPITVIAARPTEPDVACVGHCAAANRRAQSMLGLRLRQAHRTRCRKQRYRRDKELLQAGRLHSKET